MSITVGSRMTNYEYDNNGNIKLFYDIINNMVISNINSKKSIYFYGRK